MKDSLYLIFITAPVFHAEMSELKAELVWNTTQTKAGRPTNSGGEAAMNSINKKNKVSTTTTTRNETIATTKRSIGR
tara:strand:- start:29 stop:259 length:231 start_codon:yes stop_codon:yes gene_type:complete